MIKGARAGTLYLLAGVAICAAVPVLARSDPALYTGSVQLRLWERQVPYGASMSGLGLGNTPSGDVVSLSGKGPAAFTLPPGQLSLMTSLFDASPRTRIWTFGVRGSRAQTTPRVSSGEGGLAQPNSRPFLPFRPASSACPFRVSQIGSAAS